MNKTSKARRGEAGVVLLIAIFVLMLVSVIAIALIVSSGTENALAANYRSSAAVYYAAMAGLEEARGRLQSKSPDYFNNSQPGFMPPGGTPLQLGKVRYILNSSASDPVDPTDAAGPYFDAEYATEFPSTPITDYQPIPSVSGNNAAGIPGPTFKWVRINAVTEASLNLDVDGNGTKNDSTLLFYDAFHTDAYGNSQPSLIVSNSPPSTAVQALEITALAVLPNGTRKLLQYVAAPTLLSLQFPSALTLVGNNAQYQPPTSALAFYMDGNDGIDLPGCIHGAPPVEAVGYVNNTDNSQSNIVNAITTHSPPFTADFTGAGGATPNVAWIGGSLPATLQKPSTLDTLVQTITANADKVITPAAAPGFLGTADQSSLPSQMSATNPMTIVVNGNLSLNSWHGTGYGLLLVTGEFDYDPDANWSGIVLVIGQGRLKSTKGGNGGFQGAVFVAATRYPPGPPPGPPTPLGLIPDPPGGQPPYSSLGQVLFQHTGGGANIQYSSCWIKASLSATNYKVLSFRELPQ